MTFFRVQNISAKLEKAHAVVKCLHLVLSNKFINTSIHLFILNISYSKAIVYINQELSFLLKYKQEKKRRRRMTMNQEYHQASSRDTDKPEELE